MAAQLITHSFRGQYAAPSIERALDHMGKKVDALRELLGKDCFLGLQYTIVPEGVSVTYSVTAPASWTRAFCEEHLATALLTSQFAQLSFS